MYKEVCKELFDFVENSPTAFHTVQSVSEMLKAAGFVRLLENEPWALQAGGKYFCTRNGSSVIAFSYPKEGFQTFSIVAPHGDSPTFKIKESPEMRGEGYTRLNTEVYGGMNIGLWLDRPLSAAGRVFVRDGDAVRQRLVHLKRDLFVIPSLAIHMNPEVNKGVKLGTQTETLPLYGGTDADFLRLIAEEAGTEKENIISYDLYLYNREKGVIYGEKEEFIACPKLDDLQCAFSAIKAFIDSDNAENCRILSIFDNEEIGSMTRQGADSTFLSDVIGRVCLAAGKTREQQFAAIAAGFVLSADNGHAVHPGYPNSSDPTNKPVLGKGVVVKNNTRYATDGASAAVFRKICEDAKVPYQSYYKRSDGPGGSTLGNILGTHVSMNTVDIGLAQLAMHSPYETGGTKDTLYMIRAMKQFYNTCIVPEKDGFRIVALEKVHDRDLWTDISSKS